MNGHITIISCGLGKKNITPEHLVAVNSADVLAGGDRLTAWFPQFKGEVISIGAHASETVANIIDIAKDKHVAVLASGDALFFGIARLFLDKVSNDNISIIPNITAAQSALAQLKVPWQDAEFFSVHGRTYALPNLEILRKPIAVIYCDSVRTPGSVAKELITSYPYCSLRPAAIAAKLGTNEEMIQCGTIKELAKSSCRGMSMLILLPPEGESANLMIPSLSLGIADDKYEHEANLITHAEVRAVVLSKLQIRPGVMWDLGAGSGSVSVEAAGLCRGIKVYAVEAKQHRCEHIKQNALNTGGSQYEVTQGEILKTIDDLPRPNIVFIGGGGDEIKDIVTRAYQALLPGGTLVATSVLEETRSSLMTVLPEIERNTIEISVRRSVPLGKSQMMKPDNPVCIFTFKKD